MGMRFKIHKLSLLIHVKLLKLHLTYLLTQFLLIFVIPEIKLFESVKPFLITSISNALSENTILMVLTFLRNVLQSTNRS